MRAPLGRRTRGSLGRGDKARADRVGGAQLKVRLTTTRRDRAGLRRRTTAAAWRRARAWRPLAALRPLAAAAAMLLAAALGGCASNVSGYRQASLPDIPKQTDSIAPAQREHQRILATYGGAYQDARLEGLITRVGDQLVASSERPDLK